MPCAVPVSVIQDETRAQLNAHRLRQGRVYMRSGDACSRKGQGAMAAVTGSRPTVVGGPAVLVAVVMGLTVPGWVLPTTYKVLPSAVTAMYAGSPGEKIARLAVLVEVRIGITVPSHWSAT
jgi:hypothetical protein